MDRQGLFALGECVATPGAVGLGVDLRAYILRHVAGDFGTCGRYDQTDLTAEEVELGALATSDDAKLNVHAIRYGGRVLSAYETPGGKLWVITDGLDAGGNQSEYTVTTCLLPEDY
jgi:hypothetical protein